ncbi:MYOF protein, partial [Corythaixoides concolor]|nr:MYOF protein [Corythaixoides concolor]
QVLAWGLRGLRRGVRAPRLEVQCGEGTLRTPPIADLAANPNFPINAFLLKLHLPVEEEYVPPIRLRVLDTRDFGYRPEVGHACVRGLGQYCCQPPCQGQPPGPRTTPLPGSGMALPTPGTLCSSPEEEEEDEEEEDWWSKFYEAMGEKAKSWRKTNKERLKIYSCELEAVPEFEGLQDFCQTFPLYQPRGHPAAGEDPVPVGEFKVGESSRGDPSSGVRAPQGARPGRLSQGLFRIYPLPEDPEVPLAPRRFQELPPSQPQKCLVRVYVIRAFDLPPRDRNGLCDPYIRVSLGARTLGHRDQYVPNTLEPVFGRLFELTGTIPLEKDLRVSLLDYDLLPPDQEIGTTTIDLENRLLSRYRAHCGLPTLYRTAGPGRWRDQLPPSRALEHFALTETPGQGGAGDTLGLGGDTLVWGPSGASPSGASASVPPRAAQGKVQMWVDVFPATLGPPGPAVDVTPRKPQRYELRCVVWNTRDVDLADTNLLGQRMSDIYVTGWLDGLEEQRQRTDVHYRSLQGDGAFNWRFVFSFEYLAAEQLCVLPRKEHFWSLDETVLKVPPKLILQVWDNDKFSADDFLGVLELELSRLPQPAQHPKNCTPAPQGTPQSSWPWREPRTPSQFSLFRQRRARGWWPCTRLAHPPHPGVQGVTKRVEGGGVPELGVTRRRPEWSFLWLQAPLRALRYGVWRQHRCRISLGLALLLLLALLLVFVYAAPGYLAMKLVNPLQSLRGTGGER